MDEDRRIRFLVPPLLFVASLGWGMWLDPAWKSTISALLITGNSDKSIGQAITLLAGGGIIVFTVGFVIGTAGYVILRLSFLLVSRFIWSRSEIITHEVGLDDKSLRLIWSKIKASGDFDRSAAFIAAMAFDHGILQEINPGVHRWIVRRWNAFSISVTSFFGLVLSMIVGCCASIQFTNAWRIPLVIVLVIFCFSAYFSWRDTMSMLAFQATLPIPDQEGGNLR